jgi:hypothetical protein
MISLYVVKITVLKNIEYLQLCSSNPSHYLHIGTLHLQYYPVSKRFNTHTSRFASIKKVPNTIRTGRRLTAVIFCQWVNSRRWVVHVARIKNVK